MNGAALRIARVQIGTSHYTWVRAIASPAVDRLPRRSLQTSEDRRLFLREAEKVFGITEPGDWRKVRLGDLVRLPGGRSFLNHYEGSLYAGLVDILPNFNLPAFLCVRNIPKEYWRKRQHAREYFEYRAGKLGVKEPEDWAAVPGSSLWKDCGYGLVKEHGSMTAALQFAYPEVKPSRFLNRRCKPKGYWSSPERRKAFVEAIAEEFGLSEPQDWKKVSVNDIHQRGGAGFIARYSNSVIRMLKDVFPEHEWEARECRDRMPLRYWDTKSNRKAFLDEAGELLGITRVDDWASVTQGQFLQIPGSKSLLSRGTLLDMLTEAYGDGQRLASFRLRPSTPTRRWQNPDHVRDFLGMVKRELRLRDPEDWARVSQERLRQLPAGSSFVSCGISLQEALKATYPQDKWDSVVWQDTFSKKAAQHHVKTIVAGIFGYTTLASATSH